MNYTNVVIVSVCILVQGNSLSDGLDDVQRAEMKAYMELVNNMLLTAEVHTHMQMNAVFQAIRQAA